MRTLGNILWLLLCGIELCIGYAIAGVVACITVVGIPFGIASFRLAGYVVWPFGRTIITSPTSGVPSLLGNVLWILLGGIWLAAGHVIAGLLWCITIVGVPFGVANFKMSKLALMPLGRQIVPA